MNLKDSVQLEFGSVIGLLKREMESGPITNLYLNLIRSKQLATECKQTACEPSLLSIFENLELNNTSVLNGIWEKLNFLKENILNVTNHQQDQLDEIQCVPFDLDSGMRLL